MYFRRIQWIRNTFIIIVIIITNQPTSYALLLILLLLDFSLRTRSFGRRSFSYAAPNVFGTVSISKFDRQTHSYLVDHLL